MLNFFCLIAYVRLKSLLAQTDVKIKFAKTTLNYNLFPLHKAWPLAKHQLHTCGHDAAAFEVDGDGEGASRRI